MKKIVLFVIALLCFVNTCFAQAVLVGEFTIRPTGGRAGEQRRAVFATNTGEADKLLITVGVSTDPLASIHFNSDKIDEITQFLHQVKERFAEWKDVARRNRITSLRREMDFLSPPITVGWTDNLGRRWRAYNQELYPVFVVVDRRTMAVVVRKTVVASENEHITQSINWMFFNEREINDLIQILDANRIRTAVEADRRSRTDREGLIDELFR